MIKSLHFILLACGLSFAISGCASSPEPLRLEKLIMKVDQVQAGTSWGHINGKVLQIQVKKRQVSIDPDSGSTLVTSDGREILFIHYAGRPPGRITFVVSKDSIVDLTKMYEGAQISFECRVLQDSSVEIRNLSIRLLI